MTDTDERDAPGSETLPGALSRLTGALLGLARTRLDLLSVEYVEERGRLGMQLVLVFAGIGCLLFALFFTAAAAVHAWAVVA